MNEHMLVNVVMVSLVGLVFFVVRKTMTKAEEKIAKLESDVNEKIAKLMAIDDHKLVCRATQSDMKLHISKEIEKSRDVMIDVISKNRDLVEKLLKELRSDMKHNGYLKK